MVEVGVEIVTDFEVNVVVDFLADFQNFSIMLLVVFLCLVFGVTTETVLDVGVG